MASDQVLSALRPGVCVIVLNWNGWQDTIECLESVGKLQYSNYQVLIVDNGSTDDSIQQIENWAKGEIKNIETAFPEFVNPPLPKPLNLVQIKDVKDYNLTDDLKKAKWFLITLQENLGFARGMNTAIDFANKNFTVDYFYLLNNDTVVHPAALNELISAFNHRPEIAAAQSTIYFYENSKRIANAGGKILPWGQTKYYKTISDDEIKPISFINGCALCLPKATIEKFGKLTEKFFFGEEDFEFSMRAKKQGIMMVAVGSSKVYHKIGNSSHQHWKGNAGKLLIFALNRLVDMKDYYSKVVWNFWRIFTILYFGGILLFKYRTPVLNSWQIIRKIFKYSNKLNQVGKKDIEKILNEK